MQTICRKRNCMKPDCQLLMEQARALIEDVPFLITNLANISALIFESFPDINWAGFYIMKNDQLILGPFQGKPACVRIPLGKGVCGTAALEDKTLVVPDVHQFAGHIACDSASESEIVIPIHHGGKVWGVMDIDSPVKDRFSQDDTYALEKLVEVLEDQLFPYMNRF